MQVKQLSKLSKQKPKLVGHPGQDKRIGLKPGRSGGRFVTAYEPDLALQICEFIAEGDTLLSVCRRDGMPCRQTFHRWVVNYPELSRAYSAARELSAYSLEEEALELADIIRNEPGSSQRVRAFDISMNQLRWSAIRRNPQAFSEKAALHITVPIQINTGLDLGDTSAAGGTPDHPNIYEIEAQVEKEVDPQEKLRYKDKMVLGDQPLVEPGANLRKPRKRVLTPKSFTERRRRDETQQKKMEKSAKKMTLKDVLAG